MNGADRSPGGGRLIRQSAVYALGNLGVKASGLVLAPFYLNTAYLSVADYGYFALLNVTAQLGIFVAGLGLGTGLLRFLAGDHVEDPSALPFTALVGATGAALAAVGLFLVLAHPLSELLLDEAGRAGLIPLLGLYVGLKVVGSIPMALLRVRERPGAYATALVAEMGVLVGAVYVFLARQGMGLEGILWAYVVSAGAGTSVLATLMLWHEPIRFRPDLLGPLIRFGAPLVLAGLAGWFLNAGDRYLLKWLADPEVLARYEWSARLAGILNLLVVQSFQLAFAVVGLKALRDGDRRLHGETFRHFMVWGGWAVLGLSLLTFDVMGLLVDGLSIDPFYQRVQGLVLPLSLGFLYYGGYLIINNVLYATGETKAIGFNVVVAALFNAGLNVLLIPYLGAMGAALTTVAAYLLLMGLTARLARRSQPVRYPWWVLVGVSCWVAGLFWLGEMVSGGVPVRLLAKTGLVLVYFPLLFLTRIYRPSDVRELVRRGLGKWRGG